MIKSKEMVLFFIVLLAVIQVPIIALCTNASSDIYCKNITIEQKNTIDVIRCKANGILSKCIQMSCNDFFKYYSILKKIKIPGDPEKDPITDITPICALKNLQEIDLSNFDAIDLKCLGQMPKLRKLRLHSGTESYDRMKAKTPFKEWHKIKKVRFDTPSLRQLTNITNLDLSKNKINNIDFLKSLVNLETLDLDNNNISDIENIKYLNKLKTLSLNFNPITHNFESIGKLVNLEELQLNNSQITNLTPFENLYKLKSLSLSFNKINSVSPLKSLKNLAFLELSRNNIADIADLNKMDKLELLSIGYNQIENINTISKLNNLRSLKIQNNSISDISHLTGLPNLTHLYVDHNKITDTSLLKNTPGLSFSATFNPLLNCAPRNSGELQAGKICTALEVKCSQWIWGTRWYCRFLGDR